MTIATLRDFIVFAIACNGDSDAIYDAFEFSCTQEVCDVVYSLADPESPEPFRSAMVNIGFVDF
jgi:hypothetical protein